MSTEAVIAVKVEGNTMRELEDHTQEQVQILCDNSQTDCARMLDKVYVVYRRDQHEQRGYGMTTMVRAFASDEEAQLFIEACLKDLKRMDEEVHYGRDPREVGSRFDSSDLR